ncbi:unnamed protein product [Ranitomeya imitator]|uniref:LysM domain-containing protein n=1 Tax=Ranitomeya imitator TaxID=111125 RepID=A0ABN9L7N1_9NEOB|nr:unnamed protein product [Ranitomeya imitator]
MVMKKPLGTTEYIASNMDTLNSIALRFNITPNKLVELNKLFTHTIVPGQVLYVPVCEPYSSVKDANPGILASPLSSDAEYDKLPDADMARKATKPIERVLSSTSEEEEPIVVKFLKMNCRYITDGKPFNFQWGERGVLRYLHTQRRCSDTDNYVDRCSVAVWSLESCHTDSSPATNDPEVPGNQGKHRGVVGGVMIVTPNNVMFDPHKSDPLVIENGCEEYGLICPMEEVVSVALYSDISHMKIKDALPSPGEWEDLSSEKDINPFSKFKSVNKGKRQNGVTDVGGTIEKQETAEVASEENPDTNTTADNLSKVHLNVDNAIREETEQKSSNVIFDSETKKTASSPVEEDFIELVDSLSQQNDNHMCKDSRHAVTLLVEGSKTSNSTSLEADFNFNGTVEITSEMLTSDLLGRINIGGVTCEKENDETKNVELCLNPTTVSTSHSSESFAATDKLQVKDSTCMRLISKGQNEEPTMVALNNENVQQQSGHATEESPDSLSPCSAEDSSQKETQMDSESELKLWLLKRMQGPIEVSCSPPAQAPDLLES